MSSCLSRIIPSPGIWYLLFMKPSGSTLTMKVVFSFCPIEDRDRREWRLAAADPLDRVGWRLAVRSARHAASQLSTH